VVSTRIGDRLATPQAAGEKLLGISSPNEFQRNSPTGR
jgi:hypothetical protein